MACDAHQLILRPILAANAATVLFGSNEAAVIDNVLLRWSCIFLPPLCAQVANHLCVRAWYDLGDVIRGMCEDEFHLVGQSAGGGPESFSQYQVGVQLLNIHPNAHDFPLRVDHPGCEIQLIPNRNRGKKSHLIEAQCKGKVATTEGPSTEVGQIIGCRGNEAPEEFAMHVAPLRVYHQRVGERPVPHHLNVCSSTVSSLFDEGMHALHLVLLGGSRCLPLKRGDLLLLLGTLSPQLLDDLCASRLLLLPIGETANLNWPIGGLVEGDHHSVAHVHQLLRPHLVDLKRVRPDLEARLPCKDDIAANGEILGNVNRSQTFRIVMSCCNEGEGAAFVKAIRVSY